LFTGIIEEVGKISRVITKGDLKIITINCHKILQDLILGASICCDGICLTVNEFDDKNVTLSIMPQTLKMTTASKWSTGTLINLERALTLESRLDGHMVQGHVDTITIVRRVITRNNTAIITFNIPKSYSHLIVAQGSISINGVSLTISSSNERFFSISLVEFTIKHTTLGKLKVGDKVNLEFDIIGKYIYKNLHQKYLNDHKDSFK